MKFFSGVTLSLLMMVLSIGVQAGSGKLLATPGVTQVEGSGGSGLVPWATLAGYATEDEVAVSAFHTRVSVDDYRLTVSGVALNLRDRLELSVADQTFLLRAADIEIEQRVYGAKLRLLGNLVYGSLPQLSLGVQYKDLKDGAIASAVGARDTNGGTDLYLTASKLHLGALAGYNVLWTVAARGTKANQLGLLGYGGDRQSQMSVNVEATAALMLSRNLVVGVDFRQKPDNLSALEEQHWKDYFIAWIPNKRMNVTAAYVDLGTVAGARNQNGLYVSVTGYLW